MAALWAITAYFNPLRYEARRSNFHIFRRQLGLPLLAVELGFDGSFDLRRGDADLLLRRRGKDVLWHKESLLNEALAALPDECSKVAWLDCDILFGDPGWAQRLERQLDRHRLVQAFSRFHRLPRGRRRAAPGSTPTGWSLAHLMERGVLPDAHFREPGTSRVHRYTPGMAWAARRDDVQATGLYDALILGSGDRACLSAACGRQAEFVDKLGMNARQAEHYLDWAAPFAVRMRGDVTSLPGEIHHLWHGDIAHRAYCPRYERLVAFDFDPSRDIAKDPGGSWRWATDKPELHAFVERYFHDRREGNTMVEAPG